jgi:quinol monooxygenase YgiN
MIVEYIRYSIDDDRAEAFEDAYRRASEAPETSEHCERYEVSRCSEDPAQHVVRIEWDSEEGHLSGFRQSPEFRSFFEAVGPFVHDIQEMRHYQVTLSSEARARSCDTHKPLRGLLAVPLVGEDGVNYGFESV